MKTFKLIAVFYLFLNTISLLGMDTMNTLQVSPVMSARPLEAALSGSKRTSETEITHSPKMIKIVYVDINDLIAKESKRVIKTVKEQAFDHFNLDMLTINIKLPDTQRGTINPKLLNAIGTRIENGITAYPADLIDVLSNVYNETSLENIKPNLRCTQEKLETFRLETIKNETAHIAGDTKKRIITGIQTMSAKKPLLFIEYAATKFFNDYAKKSI